MIQSILNNSKNGYIFMVLLVRYEPFAICLCVGNTRQLLLYMYICTYIHICLPDINVCRPAWILIWFLFACLFVCTYFFLHFKRIYVFSGAQMFIRNAKLCFKLIDCTAYVFANLSKSMCKYPTINNTCMAGLYLLCYLFVKIRNYKEM